MEIVTRFAAVIGICFQFLGAGMTSAAQSTRHDLSTRPVLARDAIEELAGSLGKSVVCDIDLPGLRVMLGPIAKTPDRALAHLLRYPQYVTIDVSGVVIVAGQSTQSVENYSRERIAACRLTGNDTTKVDILFHAMPVETILEQLTAALGRHAVFQPRAANGKRSFNIELFEATRSDAISVVCLATHLQVRCVGDDLVFSEYVVKPPPSERQAPPN